MKDDMKVEMEAGKNIQLDYIKEIMKQNIPDLLAENQRLKEQLDREIKINRKMKSCLEKYATMELEDGVCYDSFTGETFRDEIYDLETGEPPQRLAQQVLKEIDNKE